MLRLPTDAQTKLVYVESFALAVVSQSQELEMRSIDRN